LGGSEEGVTKGKIFLRKKLFRRKKKGGKEIVLSKGGTKKRRGSHDIRKKKHRKKKEPEEGIEPRERDHEGKNSLDRLEKKKVDKRFGEKKKRTPASG